MILIRCLLSNAIPSIRSFSSTAPQILGIGDALRLTRTYSSEDVIHYSKVSHDSNPLHFDSEFARNSGFEDRIVPGMLVAALFSRIISSHFPGAVYATQSLNFKMPVYIGDEITAEVQATNIREHKKRYIAKFLTKCFKNGEVPVIDGEATTVLPTLAIERLHGLQTD